MGEKKWEDENFARTKTPTKKRGEIVLSKRKPQEERGQKTSKGKKVHKKREQEPLMRIAKSE